MLIIKFHVKDIFFFFVLLLNKVINIFAHIKHIKRTISKLFCFILLFSSLINLSAQQFNNWYFQRNNGIIFNTPLPSIITSSLIGSGNNSCASISNKSGQLLFYSDGISIWNKNNQKMPNGFSLKGADCQVNGLLIIPFLNDTSKYYLFTSQGLTFATNKADTIRYSFSIVDMNLNGGLGDVLNKNIDIRGFATEKMTAVLHSNGTDIWWICRDWTNKFYSYKITCSGFQNANPIVSVVGDNLNGDQNLLVAGDIKSSPDGNYIAVCYRFYCELYGFDKATGILSNPIKIPGNSFYGVEFSPNSKVLYITQTFQSLPFPTAAVTQYSLANYDSTAIVSSLYNVSQPLLPLGTSIPTGLQLGPDNKIYNARSGVPIIDVIDNPNVLGIGCGFRTNILPMPNPLQRRFPYSYVNLITAQNVQIPTYSLSPNCRTVTLTGKTYIKGNNLTFKWFFGDGDSTVQVVPSGGDTTFTTVSHTYPLGKDTFNVQLFVTSDTVCGLGSAGKQVIVKPPPPTAKFGVSNLCNNLTVQFTDSSLLNFNPSITYEWQFFTKNNVLLGSSNAQNPSFTFPAYDSFNVRLIARSFLSCVEADTITKTIIIKSKPTASFTYTNNCGSTSASFINSSFVTADTLSSYYWSFGAGNTSTQKNPTLNFAAYGDYLVKLVVTSSQGCVSDTFSIPVNIKEKPAASFMYNNNGCVGTPVLLQDNSTITISSINQYYWQLPSGASFTTSTINPTFTVGNNYNIKYAVTSALGCNSDTINKAVSIESIPVAAIATPKNTCVNQPFSLIDSSSITYGQINSWSWQIGTQNSIVQNPNFTFSSPANYTANLVVTSKNGCVSNTATAPITIETTPISSFTNGIACVGVPVTFTNTSTNVFGAITNTNWLINNTVQSNNATSFTNTFTQKGNYQVQLQNSTASGCNSAETKTIIVDHAIANAGKDFSVIENEPFVLQGSGGVNYNWHPPTGLSDTSIANPTGILNKNQWYQLKITTLQGCVGYDTINITVLRKLIIPNAFSPNNDGINDVWTIDQLKDYPNAQIQIFNRAGQLIHSTRNNINIWNGTHNNQPVPIGAYYYLINLNNPVISKPFSGVVMVVR